MRGWPVNARAIAKSNGIFVIDFEERKASSLHGPRTFDQRRLRSNHPPIFRFSHADKADLGHSTLEIETTNPAGIHARNTIMHLDSQ